MDALSLIQILESGLRLSVPLIFACLAGLWSEKSGIVDIGLEGKMLMAAFAAAVAAFMTGHAWIGSVTVVDEFAGWSVSHQSHLERLYGSRSVKAPSDVIPDYLARVLVGNEKQVSRGTFNGNVGNVSNPDLVWRYGVKLPKQVRLYRIVVSGVGSLNPPCLCPFNF